jgi:hypothetical protein
MGHGGGRKKEEVRIRALESYSFSLSFSFVRCSRIPLNAGGERVGEKKIKRKRKGKD